MEHLPAVHKDLGSPPQHQKEKGKNILAHAKAACPG